MKGLLPIVHHPWYSLPCLPLGHRFPMGVFQQIYQTLVAQGVATQPQIYAPNPILDRQIPLVAHCPTYVDAFRRGTLGAKEMRRIGFPWSKRLVDRTEAEVAGTILAADLALQRGLTCSTAGGTHHAHRDYGSGFCILNDIAIATLRVLMEEKAERVLIIDCDVHQGDGTAAIFANDSRVFTFSVHCQANFPARKQKSDLDLSLEPGISDDVYLHKLAEYLIMALEQSKPDLVFYDAGVDIHEDDDLGKLNISDQGLFRRDMLVLDTCLSSGVPVVGLVGVSLGMITVMVFIYFWYWKKRGK